MKSIYDFQDYRLYLKSWILQRSTETKGLQGKLAHSAGISSTLMSRILSGEKHLSLEQAVEISDYLGLNELESDYFILLVEIGKAGSHKLRTKLLNKAHAVAKKVSVRILNTSGIDENIKSIYYSSWIYAGIRNLVATPGKHDVLSISQRLALPKNIIAQAVDFLLKNGLCVQGAIGISYASLRTHLDSDSVFINNHHGNWRYKALQIMEQKKSSNLFFTSPMSLSHNTATEIRQMLPQLIETVMKKVEPSPSEKVYALNVDWFEY
ncbi:MAG: TIGR02147 family protein [Moraxellaceae bacterium]|nr:TIGR02147 family protein [Pseudobdellovibrionaceae bacterium]